MATDDSLPPDPDEPTEDPIAPSPAGGALATLDIEDEMRDSFLTYAMSVIVSRALPDVRDGLKPSQRRILVAMNDLGLSPSGSTSKCAAIVGETMKRYHPHGDASIYDTLVRMTQDWVLRYPLIIGQGNFGSVAGLPAAAHRYTEAKLAPLAADMLDDIESETVDFIDNYDGKFREPLVLPAKVPNLLINGSDGIAVGMVTDIPPHNLTEVCAGLVALIDNPDISFGELLSIIPGPDFPTGGEIRGRQGIIDGYRSGRGKITLRARAEISENGKQIIITEVPFQTTRNKLLTDIAQLIRDDRIKDISAINDYSSARNGEPVRLEIDLKRNADATLVLNQIYQFSPLQKTVSIILLALVEGRPRVLSLKEMLQEFLKHRVQVLRRRSEFRLREAKRRGHVLEGQLLAISAIDEIIRICRASPDRTEAKRQLMGMIVAADTMERAMGDEGFAALQRELGKTDRYQMTEQQAEAVVRLQLGQLAALERDEIFKEYLGLRNTIRDLEELLSEDENILALIREEIVKLSDKVGDKRRTSISDEGGDVDDEDLIPESDQVVSISHHGYLKRLPRDTFRAQRRGGRGVQGGARDDDFIEHFFIASTHAFLLCFTSFGQVYWIKVYKIPEASRTASGRSIANVLSLRPEEKISGIIPVRHFDAESELLMCTRAGTVKKTPLIDYSRPKQGGIIGISLDEGDELIEVVRVNAGDEVVLSTKNGMAIRFGESQARSMGRNTRGVRGIALGAGDEVVGMVVADPSGDLLTVCEKGYGKRTPFGANTAVELAEAEAEGVPAEEVASVEAEPVEAEGEAEPGETTASGMRYRKQKRGGKGLRDIRTGDRNGKVVAVSSVREDQDVIVVSVQGMVTRLAAREIRRVGRNTQGVRMINLVAGDKVVSMAVVAHEEVPPEDAVAVEGPPPSVGETPPAIGDVTPTTEE